MKLARTFHLAFALPLVSAVSALACGGSVIFDDGADGGGGSSGRGSSASQASNPSAGTAGPSGVGGADTGPSGSQSSSGVGGPGCLYVENSDEYCYRHSTCATGVRESECEQSGEQPGTCWCFLDGVFIDQCANTQGYCTVGAEDNCCAGVWSPG